ncbi:MAG TPA: 2OG-Fe(II) oxygenase [Casimicrobiaceae bacterium]|jgi:SM-20-related protein|nr:2OG-Fe(II) oxygenase [Casimicrobiaceae bacterium]
MTAAGVADARVGRVCAALAAGTSAVVPDFLPAPVTAALVATARRRDAAGEFRAARVGRGVDRIERSDIRGDRTLWLDEQKPLLVERMLWDALERLRFALNETTFLGLFAFEGHYALYPPGAFYRRHRDRFRDDDARVVSCVLYLNQAWTAADGGALRIHLSGTNARDVLPIGGTLVCFLADQYEHEVLPATRERLSIAGWFRRRKPASEC